jgi:hypothetical protein
MAWFIFPDHNQPYQDLNTLVISLKQKAKAKGCRATIYIFDFAGQPSGYSGDIIRAQMFFADRSINEICKLSHPSFRFSIIAIGTGSLVAYMTSEQRGFPLN